MIENAIVIKEGAKDLVSVGSTVVIEYLEDGEKDEYTIVGVKEADLLLIKSLTPHQSLSYSWT